MRLGHLQDSRTALIVPDPILSYPKSLFTQFSGIPGLSHNVCDLKRILEILAGQGINNIRVDIYYLVYCFF